MVKYKYIIKVWNTDRTSHKEKHLNSCQEVVDFLEITKHAYYNFLAGRTKMNSSKTEYLKNIEIIKKTKSSTKPEQKKKYYVRKYDPKQKLEDIINKI